MADDPIQRIKDRKERERTVCGVQPKWINGLYAPIVATHASVNRRHFLTAEELEEYDGVGFADLPRAIRIHLYREAEADLKEKAGFAVEQIAEENRRHKQKLADRRMAKTRRLAQQQAAAHPAREQMDRERNR